MIFMDVIPFASRTTTGDQTLTLSQPLDDPSKILLLGFGGNAVTIGSFPAHCQFCFGAQAGTSSYRSSSYFSKDNVGTVKTAVTNQNAALYWFVAEGAAEEGRAVVTAISGQDMTLTWYTSPGTAKLCTCVAIYGPGVDNVATGSFVVGAAVGTYSVNTGFAMQDGDILICWTGYGDTTDTQSPQGQSIAPAYTLGMATSASNQIYSSLYITPNTTSSALNATRQVSAKLWARYDTTTLYEEAKLSAFTSSGFDYEVTTSSGGGQYMYYAVLRGGKSEIITFDCPTGTGATDVTGVSLSPIGAVMVSNMTTSSASTRVNRADICVGAAAFPGSAGGTYSRCSGAVQARTINTQCDSFTLNEIYNDMGHNVGGSPTLLKSGAWKKYLPFTNPGAPDGGFNLNYVTSSTAREHWALCVGDEASQMNIKGNTNILGKTNLL